MVLALTALFLSVHLDAPPDFDELYHVLAARGWLTNGEPTIADGVYTRGRVFTVIVAKLFLAIGDGMVAARLPSLAASVLLGTLLFVWLRREVGSGVAWLSAAFFALSPFTIDIAHFARFYAIHVLAFTSGVLLSYEAARLRRPIGSAVLSSCLAIACFAVALYFQQTTLIGLAGVGLWLALAVGWPYLRRSPRAMRGRNLALASAAVLTMAILSIATGFAAFLLDRLFWSAAWASAGFSQPWFYHMALILYYPSLWSVLPLLLAAAWKRHARLTGLCAAIFLTAFILHSIAPQKAPRYITYALPFLYVLFALALAELWPRLYRWARSYLSDLAHPAWSEERRAKLATCGVIIIVLFMIMTSGAFGRAVLYLADIRVPPQPPLADWEAAGRTLEPWLRDAEIVVTTNELHALYYFGVADVTLSHSRLQELDGQPFDRDARTGRIVIADRASLELLMRCYAPGLVIASDQLWRVASQLDDEVADLLAREAKALPLPPRARLRAYWWETKLPPAYTAHCPALPPRAAGHDGQAQSR